MKKNYIAPSTISNAFCTARLCGTVLISVKGGLGLGGEIPDIDPN